MQTRKPSIYKFSMVYIYIQCTFSKLTDKMLHNIPVKWADQWISFSIYQMSLSEANTNSLSCLWAQQCQLVTRDGSSLGKKAGIAVLCVLLDELCMVSLGSLIHHLKLCFVLQALPIIWMVFLFSCWEFWKI